MLGWGLQPDWGENFSEGVEQSCEKSSFAFHIHGVVIGIPDSRSFQQLLERGFQARRLLRQRWIASASAWRALSAVPSSRRWQYGVVSPWRSSASTIAALRATGR